ESSAGQAARLSRPGGPIQRSRRRRSHRRPPEEGRAVQPLGYALALAAGALLALSFPRYGHPAIAWVALTPLIVALWHHALAVRTLWSRRAFLLGLTTGLAYFAGTIYWTGGVMAQYGGLNWPVAGPVAGVLIGYLPLFPACFGFTTHALVARYGPRGLVLVPLAW